MRFTNITRSTGKPYAGGQFKPKKMWLASHRRRAAQISQAFGFKKSYGTAGRRPSVW